MTFNDHNTALHFLNDVCAKNIKVFPRSPEAAIRFMRDRLPEFRPAFRERIQYTSLPFILQSGPDYAKFTEMLLRKPFVQSGTWLVQWCNHIWTFFYQLDLQPGGGGNWEGDATVLLAINHPIFGGAPNVSIDCRRLSGMAIDSFGNLESDGDLRLYVIDLLILIYFSRRLRWENKIIPVGQTRIHLGREYTNETTFPIEVMDSVEFAEYSEIDEG